jgi:phage terminase large subunit-like protein
MKKQMKQTLSPSLPTGVERANDYIEDVLSGKISACWWVKRACQRQKQDLAKPDWDYYFSDEQANMVCDFIESLPHIKGSQFAGQLLRLEPWQCFIITTVFGWLHCDTGLRRFKTVYIECPRKNGKSTLSAPVALFLLTADEEMGAEVYSAATTRDQAKIVWEDAKRMVDRSPSLRSALGVATSAHAIYVANRASTMKALSRDQQGNLDGLNIHGAIIDELHGHKDRGVWDVIETGTGARAQPLIWAITTAGSNRVGICYEQQAYVRKILDEVHEDNSYFGIIYTIDDADDPFDPKSWVKANPNYGISVSPDDLERKARKAMQMAAAQNNFLTKHLNVWVNADTSWMNMQAWAKCADESLDEANFVDDNCVIACDLATKVDVAAKIKLFWREIDTKIHYYVFGKYYLPEDAAEDGRNSHYHGWANEGKIVLTDGNVTDYSVIEEDIREDARQFTVIEGCFDPWQASSIMQRLQGDGLTVKEYRQTVQNMSEPMKELEALTLQGRIHHNGDPVLTWMISNVVARLDAKENIYPKKEFPENKIDGAVALIMALGSALSLQNREEQGDLNGFLNNPLKIGY